MGTVRTYGLSGDVAEALTGQITERLLRRVEDSADESPDMASLAEAMRTHPKEFHCAVMSTLIYTIGNFDRIPKMEFDAVVRDGIFQDLKEVRLPYMA